MFKILNILIVIRINKKNFAFYFQVVVHKHWLPHHVSIYSIYLKVLFLLSNYSDLLLCK